MANQQTAVTVIDPAAPVVVNLDAWPEAKFNRLIPTQTLGLASDLIRPIVQAVALDVEKDTYTSNDIPNGQRAPNAVGLSKLAAAAGVDFVDETRVDDGKHPEICGVQVYAEMVMPTGQRRRAPGTRWVDMTRMNWQSAAQRGKFKAHLYEHTATRARHRALRAILALRQSYTVAELAKPFAVVSFVPNMDHPAIRERLLDAMAPAIAAVYGPREARALQAPAIVELPEAPDDDEPPRQIAAGSADVVEGQARDEASEPDEPEWMRAAAAGGTAQAPSFADRIRAAADDPDAPKGAATKPLLEQLRAIAAPIGGSAFTAGYLALWPGANVNAISAAQARAIVLAAESDDEFAAHWADLAGAGSAAA